MFLILCVIRSHILGYYQRYCDARLILSSVRLTWFRSKWSKSAVSRLLFPAMVDWQVLTMHRSLLGIRRKYEDSVTAVGIGHYVSSFYKMSIIPCTLNRLIATIEFTWKGLMMWIKFILSQFFVLTSKILIK